MTENRGQKIEVGLRPVGAIGAYAPEGSGKLEFAMMKFRA